MALARTTVWMAATAIFLMLVCVNAHAQLTYTPEVKGQSRMGLAFSDWLEANACRHPGQMPAEQSWQNFIAQLKTTDDAKLIPEDIASLEQRGKTRILPELDIHCEIQVENRKKKEAEERDSQTPKAINARKAIRAVFEEWVNTKGCKSDMEQSYVDEFLPRIKRMDEAKIVPTYVKNFALGAIMQGEDVRKACAAGRQAHLAPKHEPPTPEQRKAGKAIEAVYLEWVEMRVLPKPGSFHARTWCTPEMYTMFNKSWPKLIAQINAMNEAKLVPEYVEFLESSQQRVREAMTKTCAAAEQVMEKRIQDDQAQLQAEADRANAAYAAEAPARYQRDLLRETQRHNLEMERAAQAQAFQTRPSPLDMLRQWEQDEDQGRRRREERDRNAPWNNSGLPLLNPNPGSAPAFPMCTPMFLPNGTMVQQCCYAGGNCTLIR